jgi:hypothetical protein
MYTEQEFPTYSTNTRIALALFLLCVSLAGRRSGTRGGFALYEVIASMPHVAISSEIRLWEKLGRLLEDHPYAVSLYLMSLPHAADGTLLPKTPRGFWAIVAPTADIPFEQTEAAIRTLVDTGMMTETPDGLRLVFGNYWKPLSEKTRYVNRAKRDRIIARDEGRCFYCGREVPPDQREVDHKLPKSRGGSDRDDNLVTACRRCNQAKGTMTAAEFMAQEA